MIRLADALEAVPPEPPGGPLTDLLDRPDSPLGARHLLSRLRTFAGSAFLHAGLVLAVVVRSWIVPSERPEPPQLEIVFHEPIASREAERPEPIPPLRKSAPPEPPSEAKPVPPPPRSAANIVPPAPMPREVPPPVPVPPPKRMGEKVPVPHLPAPGSVSPDASAMPLPPPGSPGGPETPKPGGEPEGSSSLDGTALERAGGASPDPGGPGPLESGGAVAGTRTGGLEVPRLSGGARPDGEGTAGGGRRGLDLSLPPGRGAFGDFSFEDKDYDWSDYWSQMYWAIWRAWMNRLYVGLSTFDRWSVQRRTQTLRGTVLIRFVIERNGSVSAIEVLEPSILSPLDDSAQAALKEAILPRLPEDFAKDREAVTGRFSMEIDSLHSWREELKYMKYRGVF